jgi:addiction module HigA family antidote
MFAMANPSHPGAVIRGEILAPRKLNVTQGAEALGVTRPALSAVLNERASLSAEMALRIEKAFGVSMELLLRIQLSFDIAKARGLSKSIHVKKWGPAKTKNGAPKRAAHATKAAKAINR